MKSKSIKIDILINFFISMVFAMIVTVMILFTIIFILHISSSNFYLDLINLYNSSNEFMMGLFFVIFGLFIVNMSLIFIKRMDKITNYIKEISVSVNKVTKGNLDIKVPINSKNELGTLAEDVNEMVFSINNLIKKEREWEKNKNNLITNISHDLRTPLTSVIGFIELIKEKKYNSEEEFNHYCEITFNKAKELKESIDQLFEFTKVSNGDIKLKKSKICINELIAQVIMGYIPLFQDNNMEYRMISEEDLIWINGDAILLVRVFQNIITNAIKYGSSGKYLDIKIKRDCDKTLISFINYGDMIEKNDLDKLFDRLYRVEKKSNKREGTGLGLAISKTIVDMHGGNISVNSSKEKTEFKIIL